MFPSYPGTPGSEIFLNAGHPVSALTNDQLTGMLGDMNFEVIESSNRVAELVDKLWDGYHYQNHPSHFLNLLWNEDLENPKHSGIIIYRANSATNMQHPVDEKGWFIDTRSLPESFMSIRGYTSVSENKALAQLLININWACYDAERLASGFRACFGLGSFRKLKDLKVFAEIACEEDAERLAAVQADGSFFAMLRILAAEGRTVHWDYQRLQACEARIRNTDQAQRHMQRPLSDDSVYRYLRGIRYLVDIYKWTLNLRRRGLITRDDWRRTVPLSREHAWNGFQLAMQHGYEALIQSHNVETVSYQDDLNEDEPPRGE